jgi:glycine/D-amino acid oxidase-like deaminating enzyme
LIIIGCGLSGATSALSAAHFSNHTKNITIICPSLYSSTSANSGRGWLLVPNVEDETILLNELEDYAHEKSLNFDRSKAAKFVQNSRLAKTWIQELTNIYLEPVPS